MKPLPQPWLRFRMALLVGIFSCLFVVVFARAYQFQILESKKLASLAEKQYQRMVALVPKRGIVYDRKREEMAISVEVDSVFAQPPKIAEARKTAVRLSPLLQRPGSVLYRKMKEDKPFVWLERGITAEQRARIEALEISGIGFLKENKRFYPQGKVGAHVIGFAGLDSKGLEGLELAYDEFIRGEPGYMIIAKDGLGRTLTPKNPQFSRSMEGCEIIMTIDKNIQYIVEKELQKAVEASSAKGGMAVVMNPRTGEVLAMAVHPPFDLNHFSTSPANVRRNRTITDAFEPGSTFKIFLLAAALEEGVTSPKEIFFCENGSYMVGGKVIHDAQKHKWLSLKDIIKVSSNIGAAKVGRKLGKTKFHRYLSAFGFGARTGIDLPGEVSGSVPAPQDWSEVGLANISFGQGISVTPLQLTVALAAIAHDGVLMRPYVVKAVQERGGQTIRENHPRALRRVISPRTAQAVRGILKTVLEEGGTGTAARIAGYEVAGKTGTAQKASATTRGYSDKRIASFIGMAPVENPQFVLTVLLDEPKGVSYGGVVAAPAFRAMGEQILPYIGVYPKGVTFLARAGSVKPPEGKWLGDDSQTVLPTQSLSSEPGRMPDFSGQSLRQVVLAAQRLGLDLALRGSGKAISQNPEPGRMIRKDQKGWVKFQPTL
jgi:cell division protein FtsI (penicillin-binding protein 3)